jgi:hypothetical protein
MFRSSFGNLGPLSDCFLVSYDWTLVEKFDANWDQRLRAIYDYWRKLPRPTAPLSRTLPARRSWDVLDVAPVMPHTRFLEARPWENPPGWRYLCRLVGTDQADALGMDPTGQWMDQAEPATWNDERFMERQLAMRSHRLPTWRRGRVMFERDRLPGMLECLQLPFASDGINVDMIADITFYSANTPA